MNQDAIITVAKLRLISQLVYEIVTRQPASASNMEFRLGEFGLTGWQMVLVMTDPWDMSTWKSRMLNFLRLAVFYLIYTWIGTKKLRF